MFKALIWAVLYSTLAYFKMFHNSEIADNLMVFLSLLTVLAMSLALLVSMAEDDRAYSHFVEKRRYLDKKFRPYALSFNLVSSLSMGIAGHPVLGVLFFTVSLIVASQWYSFFERWEKETKGAAHT